MISARLTEEEWQKLRKLCAVSGLPVSAVLRELICGVTIRQRPPKELHDLYTEINRIGTNCHGRKAVRPQTGHDNREYLCSCAG